MEKKIKLKRDLSLNKEAIVKLQDTQMLNLRGGISNQKDSLESCWYLLSCMTSCGIHS